ncbi:MAG: DoxX family protein [Chloroflexi bacterium]|nr:MAG: DoxX family protein [Chloroflexota bacterium]
MNIALWIVQGLLAVVFLMAGFMKVSQPREKLAENMAFVEDFSDNNVRLIGILEILAAIGLILPPLTNILPWLAPLAAIGLVLTMIGAAMTHSRRGGEGQMIGTNVVLLLLAAFVAYGRFILAPF